MFHHFTSRASISPTHFGNTHAIQFGPGPQQLVYRISSCVGFMQVQFQSTILASVLVDLASAVAATGKVLREVEAFQLQHGDHLPRDPRRTRLGLVSELSRTRHGPATDSSRTRHGLAMDWSRLDPRSHKRGMWRSAPRATAMRCILATCVSLIEMGKRPLRCRHPR